MAAHIARQSALFYHNATICGFSNHIRPWGHVVKQIGSSFKLCAFNGSKASRPSQENPVHIPVERLTVSYSKSSGPGGQHVNKVNTKAEVRFHVHTADWIPEDVKRNMVEKNKNRINKSGELLVTSELSRSQHRNLSDCIQKISDIIAEASEKPYEPTAEDIALRAARLEKSNKERLKQKKIASNIKQNRRVGFD
uniref:Large ribosomal subunit protein mL62 n=1 Tax=Neogobius melanostomus TaxID=47308 RepID=A0A8C6SH35_9GOBI